MLDPRGVRGAVKALLFQLVATELLRTPKDPAGATQRGRDELARWAAKVPLTEAGMAYRQAVDALLGTELAVL